MDVNTSSTVLLGFLSNLDYNHESNVARELMETQQIKVNQAREECFRLMRKSSSSSSTILSPLSSVSSTSSSSSSSSLTSSVNASKSMCPMIWDSILCWPPTPSATEANLSCPHYIDRFNTTNYAFKYCTSAGTWFERDTHSNETWTDYSACYSVPDFPPLLLVSKGFVAIKLFNSSQKVINGYN